VLRVLRLVVVLVWGVSGAAFAAASSTGCGDEAAKATPFTVWVLDEGASAADVGLPLGGAQVAFDPPGGGERIVRATAPDGHVTFETDLARGGAAVTVASTDHVVLTLLDARPGDDGARATRFGKPAADLVAIVPRLDDAIARASVGLSGAIRGKLQEADLVSLSVSGLRRLGNTETREAAFAMRAPRDRPFLLLGHELRTPFAGDSLEHVRSFLLEVPARATDGAIDVDVAAAPPLPTRTVVLELEPPRGAGSPFGPGTRASAAVLGADSDLLPGAFVKSAERADGRGFDVTMAVAEVDAAGERIVTRAIVSAPDGSFSVESSPGASPSGRVTGFLLPPAIPEASRSLADGVPLSGFPAGAELEADVFAGRQRVWVLRGPAGGLRGDRLDFPAPFGISFSPDVQVFAVRITARMDALAGERAAEVFRHVASSRDVLIRRL